MNMIFFAVFLLIGLVLLILSLVFKNKDKKMVKNALYQQKEKL